MEMIFLMNNNRVIPKKNYIILSVIIVASIVLLYYFYMWFLAYKDSKINMPILDKYVNVINYNELDNYIVENPDDVTVLVNKLHEIPEGWKPDDLEKVIDCSQKLRHEANQAYTQFYQAAKEKGIEIYTISGYREPETQQLYWDNSVKVFGQEHAIQYKDYNQMYHLMLFELLILLMLKQELLCLVIDILLT